MNKTPVFNLLILTTKSKRFRQRQKLPIRITSWLNNKSFRNFLQPRKSLMLKKLQNNKLLKFYFNKVMCKHKDLTVLYFWHHQNQNFKILLAQAQTTHWKMEKLNNLRMLLNLSNFKTPNKICTLYSPHRFTQPIISKIQIQSFIILTNFKRPKLITN